MRPIPAQAISLVKEFEGCRLVGYADIAGVPTWGYGHTGPEVKVGQTITQDQADAYLIEDLDIAQRRLNNVISLGPLNDNQFSALLSFVFNLGANPAWGIWIAVNNGEYALVHDKILQYNKARVNGNLVPIAGLTRRRQAEADLWSKPI